MNFFGQDVDPRSILRVEDAYDSRTTAVGLGFSGIWVFHLNEEACAGFRLRMTDGEFIGHEIRERFPSAVLESIHDFQYKWGLHRKDKWQRHAEVLKELFGIREWAEYGQLHNRLLREIVPLRAQFILALHRFRALKA